MNTDEFIKLIYSEVTTLARSSKDFKAVEWENIKRGLK
jgi:hypothetical protein